MRAVLVLCFFSSSSWEVVVLYYLCFDEMVALDHPTPASECTLRATHGGVQPQTYLVVADIQWRTYLPYAPMMTLQHPRPSGNNLSPR